MTTRLYSSLSQQTTITAAMTASQTTMVVQNAAALLANSVQPTGTQTFTVVIDPDTALEEIVDVVYPSIYSNNTLTIVRGIETAGTGIAHSAGAAVRHMGIGRDFREANTHIDGTLAQHSATTSAELRGVISDETGTGSLVFATSPTLVTPALGTPASATLTNATGLPLTTGVTGTLPVANGGTGVTTSTGSGSNVLSTSPTLVTPVLGTPTSVTLTNATGLPVTTGISGLGTGVATFLGTPSSTNLAAAVTGETGSGALVFGTSPAITSAVLTTPAIGTAGATFAGSTSGTTTLKAAATASGTVTIPAVTGTVITTGDTGTVTSTMIANGTIADTDISASAGIAYSKLSLGGSITSADIVDGTIVATDIANGTITAAKMVSDPYARGNHTGTQTASTISDFDTQVRTSKVTDLAAPTGSFSMNSQKITNVADPTLAQDASTKAYVDAQVNALVNGAPGTLDTIGEIAAALSSGGSVVSTLVAKAGDTMTGALILNADPTTALGAATKQYVDSVAGTVADAEAAATAAEAAYDSFDDRYLGSKSSAPTLDNDGNALIEGALYWNSASKAMYIWTGSAWGSISSTADIFRYRFNATGGETSLSGTDANGLTLTYLVGKEQVYLNGVLLVRTTDYTASNGSSITSLAALSAGDVVEIVTFTAFSTPNTISSTVLTTKGDVIVASGAGTAGRLGVGTNNQVLMADSSQSLGVKWGTLDALPTQSGNSGKYLTTDGTTATWGTIITDPTPDIFMLMGA